MIDDILIKEDDQVPIINAERKIVIWAPDPLKWDANISLLSCNGSAITKVDPVVTYSADNKELRLTIKDNFAYYDSIFIHGMRVKKDISIHKLLKYDD